MDDLALWNRMREAWSALGEVIDRAVNPIVEESGLNGRGWGLLLAVLTFEPDHTTPAHLMVRSPYTAVEEYRLRLGKAAGLGFLEEVAPSEFRLTPSGRKATQRFIRVARQAMAAADPLPIQDCRRLSELLDRLVQRSLETPPPPDTWSIRLSHKLMPASDPPLPYAEQAFSCLAAYRDDAHLAAWQKSELAATALEALTLLWRGEARELGQVTEKLAHRGHTPHVYEDAILELRQRGYVAGTPRALRLTDAGQRFRDQVEEDTNCYFFAPWSVLSNAEKDEAGQLADRLRDGLRGRKF